MHEFSLYSQIPLSRLPQVLNIFAGVTGSQPVTIHEQTLIYMQLKVPDPSTAPTSPTAASTGGPGSGTPRARNNASSSKPAPTLTNLRPQHQKLLRTATGPDAAAALGAQPWRLRTEHVPEPGASTISRPVQEGEATAGELARLRDVGLTRYVGQQLASGVRFVHGNVVVRVYRLLLLPPPAAGAGAPGSGSGTGAGAGAGEGGMMSANGSGKDDGGEGGGSVSSAAAIQDAIAAEPPAVESLRVVDASGSYVVEAAVRVEDGGDAKVVARATAELHAFAADMQGAVNFVLPDRLALDPRVKSA